MQYATWARPELRPAAEKIIGLLQRWRANGFDRADDQIAFVKSLAGADRASSMGVKPIHVLLGKIGISEDQAWVLVYAATFGYFGHDMAGYRAQWVQLDREEQARFQRQRALREEIAKRASELIALLKDPLVRLADDQFPGSVVSLAEIQHQPGIYTKALIDGVEMNAWIAPGRNDPWEPKFPNAPEPLWRRLEHVVQDIREWRKAEWNAQSWASALESNDDLSNDSIVEYKYVGNRRVRVVRKPRRQFVEPKTRKANPRVRFARMFRLQLFDRGDFIASRDLDRLATAVTLLVFAKQTEQMRDQDAAIMKALKRAPLT
jgi:hypothetical protein